MRSTVAPTFCERNTPSACIDPSTEPPHSRRRVTQETIAEIAGVHNTTVSLALRNSPSLPARTRERIQAIAAELGYRPDPALRALVSYRRGMSAPRRVEAMAIVTMGAGRHEWRSDAILSGYVEGIMRKTEELGFRHEFFWLDEPGLTSWRLSQILHHRGIEAALLVAHPWQSGSTAGFDWSRLCGVAVGFIPADSTLRAVVCGTDEKLSSDAGSGGVAHAAEAGAIGVELLADQLQRHARELPKIKVTTVVGQACAGLPVLPNCPL